MKKLNYILTLLIVILLMYASLSFAQTLNIQTPSTDSATVPAPTTVKPLPANTGATSILSPTGVKKCGVNTFTVNNECGLGAFKNAYVQCYDGSEENLGGESSCKSSEVWQKYATETCANRCSVIRDLSPKPVPTPIPAPQSLPTPKPTSLAKPIAVCVISDSLMKEYNGLILALQKTEQTGDKEAAEALTKKIIALKQEISASRKECEQQPTSISAPSAVSGAVPTPVAVNVDRCAEITQWENKIVYYKKLSSLSDTELKNSGFSRPEIERILTELATGVEKVKAQCENQKTAETKPTEVLKQIIVEPVKPVAVESGQEIDAYYKARIGKITASENTEEQIVKLKTLRNEIDELVSNLIKSRKEMEASEFKDLVEEVKISKGEIKADNVSVLATDKKILVEVGSKSISVEPTAKQVLIRDENLEVTATEISIKDNALRVGNSEVKLAASEVAETLGIDPQSAELKEENSRAVYKLKVAEPRKLFGFIPIRITKTMTADAESSDLLDEKLPWYSFLTTR